jgi:DNA-binding NarL/FixJ family response regulator
VAEAGTHRVVVVEDHPIFRDGVVQCLDAEPDFTVVGQWASGDVDLDALSALAPDLVLMDVELPVVRGSRSRDASVRSSPMCGW